jgi:acetyl-CoA carboxylase biotin carboxyl carrier protein
LTSGAESLAIDCVCKNKIISTQTIHMDIKEIRSLVELMKKNGIAVFKLERENFKITLKTNEASRAFPPTGAHSAAAIPPSPASAQALPAPVPQPTAQTPPAASDTPLREIRSPMVGTFYAAPSPDAQPFVSVGQTVGPDTVVCIIEAMKVMNEIKAELSGTIVEICAENGKPVQFGQTLFRVR